MVFWCPPCQVLPPSHVATHQHTGTASADVKLTTNYHADFGDSMKLIGSSPELGAWVPEAAPMMSWSEGHWWSTLIRLPAGAHEFKVGRGLGFCSLASLGFRCRCLFLLGFGLLLLIRGRVWGAS